jgi:hypothetical protein
VAICRLQGAYFLPSDFDVDCDGGTEPACTADPWYLPETSATDSHGDPVDASHVPFIVVPLPSTRFSYRDADIHLGAAAVVVYHGLIAYAVFADEGRAASARALR